MTQQRNCSARLEAPAKSHVISLIGCSAYARRKSFRRKLKDTMRWFWDGPKLHDSHVSRIDSTAVSPICSGRSHKLWRSPIMNGSAKHLIYFETGSARSSNANSRPSRSEDHTSELQSR